MNAREIRKHISMDDILANCRISKSGCWLWQASLHNDGYAAWNVGGKQIKVHRAAYLLEKGPIPRKHFVYHTCGKKHCCNPECLVCGNHKKLFERNAEAGNVARGERNGYAKLTAKDVRKVRRLAKTGKYSHRQIGDMVGCHQTNVTRILNGNYWAHVK
ncbi:MAG: HNH endonuclease [Planctomycetota bacterium]